MKYLSQFILHPDLINQDADHSEKKLIESPVEHAIFSPQTLNPNSDPMFPNPWRQGPLLVTSNLHCCLD